MPLRPNVDTSAVLGVAGLVLVTMGAAQLVPALLAFALGGPGVPLLIAACGIIACGALLVPFRRLAERWTRRESLAAVVVSWITATVAAAVPYVAAGAAGPLDALFESLSGLTTTGASIFADVDALATTAGAARPESPLPLHVWRCFTHWLGGAGIILVVFLLTPFLHDSEALRRTQQAEASFAAVRYRGSTRATVRGLIGLYVGLTLVQTLAMWALGVGPLDALLHSFGTVATGGFSTHTASMATWGPSVQLVTVLFMVLGALNFAVMGRAVEEVRAVARATRATRGLGPTLAVAAARAVPIAARSVWRNVETRAYLLLVLGASVLLTAILLRWGAPRYQGADGLGSAVLDGVFNAATVSTTTGFGTEDFARWPWVAQALLVSLILVGGCSGSTAGGLKMRRILIVGAFALREVRRCAHPRGVFPVRLGHELLSEDQLKEALGYVAVYVGLVVLVTVGVTATGADAVTAAGSTASCFASTGPGLGAAGPAANYQVFSPTAKLLLMGAMLLGRLEIYPLLVALVPTFWLRAGTMRARRALGALSSAR